MRRDGLLPQYSADLGSEGETPTKVEELFI